MTTVENLETIGMNMNAADEGIENILDVNNDDGTICSKIVHSGTTETMSVSGKEVSKSGSSSSVVCVKATVPINVEFDVSKKAQLPPKPILKPKKEEEEEKEEEEPKDEQTVDETDSENTESNDEEEEEEERDFDKNPTVLYALVQKKIWAEAMDRAKSNPEEASVWVSRREKDGKLRWRLLPLHAAIVFKASPDVIESLLTAYPQAAETKDDQGMLPLHLAFRNGASEAVVHQLLMSYPYSVDVPDRKGRVPLTLAQAAAEPHRDIFVGALEKGPSYYAAAAIENARVKAIKEQEEIFEAKLEQVRTVHQCEVDEVKNVEGTLRSVVEERVVELEADLAKTMETSQVLVDHVNSLEAQLASRSDTERFLATKIANLDEKLKVTESTKAETEACLSTEKSNLSTERDTLAAKVNELQAKLEDTEGKLDATATALGSKGQKWEHTEKELKEKLSALEVEAANEKANAAILEAQLKKRMQNEQDLASQVGGLANRLAEAALEQSDSTKKYDAQIAELQIERTSLIETVDDLTLRLKDAAKAMESMRAQQMKIIDGAISHEQIVSKALEAHAEIVTDAARQQQELEIAKEERAIVMQLLAKQEESYHAAFIKRSKMTEVITMQGKTLTDTKQSREDILSCVTDMNNTMSGALQNILGGIEIGTSASSMDEDDNSVSAFEHDATEELKTEEEAAPIAEPEMVASEAEVEEMVMIGETKFEAEAEAVGPEIVVSAPSAPKKLEEIMKDISAASVGMAASVLEAVTAAPETRAEEVSSKRSNDGDRIMESREM
ncbi:MAG: hypothetical protein SGILL_000063 [Bacillariaceae sp.]